MPDLRRRMRSVASRSAVAVSPRLRRLVEQTEELAQTKRELAFANRQIAALHRRDEDFTGLGYVFIVTYGRSGSTLLQGILNTIPGWVVRGEHNDALNWLSKYHRGLVRARDEHTLDYVQPPKSPWYGIDGYNAEAAIRGLRGVVLTSLLRPAEDTRVIGFKEIRWQHKDWKGYVTFLRQLFPGARFVINTRDKDAVLKSKWWAEHPEASAHFDRYEKRLFDIQKYVGDAAYAVHFDDWVADPTALCGLYDWLGEPMDLEAVTAVMQERHSF